MEGIMKFKNNTFESWALPPLRMEIPIDKEEYSLEGRTFPNIPGFTDGPTNAGSGEKAKITFSDDDAEDNEVGVDGDKENNEEDLDFDSIINELIDAWYNK
jgi:hypothetical protein